MILLCPADLFLVRLGGSKREIVLDSNSFDSLDCLILEHLLFYYSQTKHLLKKSKHIKEIWISLKQY